MYGHSSNIVLFLGISIEDITCTIAYICDVCMILNIIVHPKGNAILI